MSALFQQAVGCDPAADSCVLSETLTDVCGCGVSVNGESNVIPALQDAYDAWVANGCGPVGCGAPCPVGEAGCIDADVPYCGFVP